MSPWPLPPGPPSRPGQCLFLPCLPRAPRCLQAPLLLSQAYPLLPRTRAPRHQARGLGMEGCLAHERGAGPGTWEGRRRSGLRPATVRRRRGRIRPRRGARGGAGRAPPPAPRDVTDSPGVQASGSPSGSPTRVGQRGLSLASHTDPGAGPAAGHLSRQQLRRRLEPPRRGILAEAAAARLGAPRGPPGWGAGGGLLFSEQKQRRSHPARPRRHPGRLSGPPGSAPRAAPLAVPILGPGPARGPLQPPGPQPLRAAVRLPAEGVGAPRSPVPAPARPRALTCHRRRLAQHQPPTLPLRDRGSVSGRPRPAPPRPPRAPTFLPSRSLTWPSTSAASVIFGHGSARPPAAPPRRPRPPRPRVTFKIASGGPGRGRRRAGRGGAPVGAT